MFVSFSYGGIGSDASKFDYVLKDSQFGEVSGVGTMMIAIGAEIGILVIREYSKRNLNVAANLAAAFVWLLKQYPFRRSIQQIIDDNKEYNPLFPPYEEDLQKYLVLL
jgi:hypothetical protein